MSRFNFDAYDKLFPRQPEPTPAVETAVQGFTPSKNILEGKQPDVQDPEPDQDPLPVEPEILTGGDSDGDGGDSKPDPE